MVSNIPTNLILAGLIALIALPFVVVGCSIYVADRLVRALHAIYRLEKEQAATVQRSAVAVAAAMATVPAPSLVPPEQAQSGQAAVAGRVPASPQAASAPAPVAPAERRLEVQTEQSAAVQPASLQAPAADSPSMTRAVNATPLPAAADSNPDAPGEPHPVEQSEAELEALRARVRQMTLGG